MKKFIFFFSLFFPVLVSAEDISTPKAVLQAMDKITGRVKKIHISVGEKVNFGELSIQLEKCLKKPPEETPENAAFLRIFYSDTPDKDIFKGWMFSSNPALSAMEDPVYDIWVDSCQEIKPEVPVLIEHQPEALPDQEEQEEVPSNEPIED